MIKFINYAIGSINGSIITSTDLYLELCNYFDTEMYFKFYINKQQKSMIMIDNMNMVKNICCLNNKYKIFKKDTIKSDDTIITTYYTIYHNRISKQTDQEQSIDLLKYKAKNLIILDSLDIYIDYTDNKLEKTINDLSKCYKNVYLLSNPYILNLYKKLNLNKNINIIEYYNKLSKIRLDKLGKNINNNKILIRSNKLKYKYDNYYLYNDNTKYINSLVFKGHGFMRINHNTEQKPIYIENIGKLFFEYLYLDRPVDYYINNLVEYDGMCYYMKLLNLDGMNDIINVKVDRQLLLDNIIFNENDYIIKLLNKII